jgi:hypothetical protein
VSGDVNSFRNHLLDTPGFEKVLPAAGFDIVFTGMTTYQLVANDWRQSATLVLHGCPLAGCTSPMTEVQAVQRTGE